MRKTLFLVALLLCSVLAGQAEGRLSPLTRAFLAQRASVPELNRMVRMGDRGEMVDCFVHFNRAVDEAVLARYGAELNSRFDNLRLVTATVPVARLEALAEDAAIRLVEIGLPVAKQMDIARQTSMVDAVQNGVAPLEQSYLGRGVVVGVVDGDMQYDHPAFWNAAHTRYRIKRTWLQASRSGTHPAGYSYGAEYKDSASILNLRYDVARMSSGHATHVTNIAAGADHSLNYWGVAQEADIVYVSADASSSVGIVDGVKYCLDYARSVGKPCVVNVSMGSTLGPHDGFSTESIVLDGLAGPGRVICGSAGNSGGSKLHCSKALSAEDSVLRTFFQFKSIPGYQVKMGMVDIWGGIGQNFTVSLVAYNKDTKQFVYRSPALAPSGRRKHLSIDSTVVEAHDLKFAADMVPDVRDTVSRGNVIMTVTMTSLPSRTGLGIEIVSAETGEVNLYSMEDFSTFTDVNQPGWTDGDSRTSVDEPMGVTENVVSVGAYTSKPFSGTRGMGDIASFSSVGPTADGRTKPDITAPGKMIMSALPDQTALKDSREAETTVGGKTYYYAKFQGTSMSSPYCAGVIATWLEANPQLDKAGVMDVFRHSLIVDEFTGAVPNCTWGLGKVNAFDGLVYILGKNTGVANPESPEVIAAYPNPTRDDLRVAFATADAEVRVTVADLSGRTVVSLTAEDVAPGSELTIPMADAPAGAYIVRVTGRRVNRSFKVLKY